MNKTTTSKLVAALLLGIASSAMAAPVSFSVTGASIAPGAGYVPLSGATLPTAESTNQDLLDVYFLNTFGSGPQNATLSQGGSYSFSFGLVRFIETAISSDEASTDLNRLRVSATFTFGTPTSGPQTLTASGTAVVGNTNDSAVDYSLAWTALTGISFGSGGGLYDISVNPISFTRPYSHNNYDGDQVLRATVTLTKEPGTTTPANQIPEPGTLALVGAALALTGLVRRRRPAAV